MNTESSQDQTVPMTTGERLRQAREKLGLSQQVVAERLCLKLSTVRDLEDDRAQADLASTFLRGYIRSYAKLVHIPEEDVESMLAREAPLKAAVVAPMQSFSLGKTRKKRDGWLMMFTGLIFLVVIGLTGAWWWQNHKAQQAEIVTMVEQSSAQLSDNAASSAAGQPVPLSTADTAASAADSAAAAAQVLQGGGEQSNLANSAPAQIVVPSASDVVAPSQASLPGIADVTAQLPTAAAQVAAAPVSASPLVMNFSADCWLEVKDGSGKTLFSGMQRKGGTLNLAGTQPFSLKIGAPAAVEIQFQGKPVDLSRFVKSSSVARLTLPAQ